MLKKQVFLWHCMQIHHLSDSWQMFIVLQQQKTSLFLNSMEENMVGRTGQYNMVTTTYDKRVR